jgi:hypothetical protein
LIVRFWLRKPLFTVTSVDVPLPASKQLLIKRDFYRYKWLQPARTIRELDSPLSVEIAKEVTTIE